MKTKDSAHSPSVKNLEWLREKHIQKYAILHKIANSVQIATGKDLSNVLWNSLCKRLFNVTEDCLIYSVEQQIFYKNGLYKFEYHK